jgi:hypothetical protein
MTSQSSIPSWLHTFASTCLSGRCCSPGKASYRAYSQRLSGYRIYPEGLRVLMDHSSIPSLSFTAHTWISLPIFYGKQESPLAPKWYQRGTCCQASISGMQNRSLHTRMTREESRPRTVISPQVSTSATMPAQGKGTTPRVQPSRTFRRCRADSDGKSAERPMSATLAA